MLGFSEKIKIWYDIYHKCNNISIDMVWFPSRTILRKNIDDILVTQISHSIANKVLIPLKLYDTYKGF